MIYRVVIFFVSVFLLLGCSGGRHDARLEHVAGIVSDSPREALSCLDSIDWRSLSTRDRHYHDFLSLKARDKAYIVHESDSLILDLLDYYSSDKRMYPEVLYYGGRVYSDLGDYPTALRYFQTALDEFDDGSGNLPLKSNILSQTGRLLNSLRLHRQAVPYLQESLGVDSILKDTFRLAYDHLLLGDIYDKTGEYDRAEDAFRKAYNWGEMISPAHAANTRIYLASAKLHKGKVDSALNIIRPISGDIRPAFRNAYLALSSEVYYRSGIYDTAYIYAHELVLSSDTNNRKTGLRMILTPELRKYIPKDSVDILHNLYKTTVDAYIDSHEGEQVVVQNSIYNYSIHERERAKAEKSNVTLRLWLLGSSILVLLLGIVILFLKNRDANNRLKLHAALENVERLKQSLKIEKEDAEKDQSPVDVVPVEKKLTTSELREKLRKELLDIYESNSSRSTIDREIVNSDTYREIQTMILGGEELKEDNRLWSELESLVLRCSPNFISNLQLLTGGNLTSSDLHTALLIKCGIQPTQMSILLNRSKGAIVSRRESLCYRIYGEKLGTKVIDGIIRLL